ncbi:MAG TPA: NYN domain-containing protein [Dehalococcoidia bacterium]|nr:NYN domain-containing protein [Dehalococcoidia bacterium]
MQGIGTGEVGLFIDLENIRYSFLNVYQIEPNVAAFIEKAKKHGRVSVAMAYADFNEHPSWVRRALDVAGIAARDIPVRRFVREGQDRVKSSADLHMLMDIMETALDRPQVQTYVLMTGDSDYIRVVTWIKNRFDKRVIVCGVPGTISSDLVAAAGESDHLESEQGATPEALLSSIEAIALMMKRTVPPTGFWTIRLIDQWARDSRNGVPGSDPDKSNAISYMLRNGLMRRYKTVTDVREVTISELDETHPMVRQFILSAGLQLDPLPRRCSACNARGSADAERCSECGAEFAAAAQPEQPA